jgi:hypothetical protein
MKSIRDLIANDGYAMSFQSMGQYRTALLKALDQAVVPIAVKERPILKSNPFNDELGRCWCGTVAFIDYLGDTAIEYPMAWELRVPEPEDNCLLPVHAIPPAIEALFLGLEQAKRMDFADPPDLDEDEKLAAMIPD